MRTSQRRDANGLRKGAWSPQEDQLLIEYIKRYRIWNWNLMPKFAGLSRTGKSCRLRWVNYLHPELNHGSITKEEEDTIIHIYSEIGSRWSVIAARLQGRTDNQIKNYWHTHLKKHFEVKKISRIKIQRADKVDKFDANDILNSNNSLNNSSSSNGGSAHSNRDQQDFWSEEEEYVPQEWYQEPLSPYELNKYEYWFNHLLLGEDGDGANE